MIHIHHHHSLKTRLGMKKENNNKTRYQKLRMKEKGIYNS